jgi:hypothetical protein
MSSWSGTVVSPDCSTLQRDRSSVQRTRAVRGNPGPDRLEWFALLVLKLFRPVT